jgi:hypothetical protein
MPDKSLSDRVKAAFGESGSSGNIAAKDFLQQLHSENQNLRAGFRGSMIRLFFFGLFILLSASSVSEATIGPIKITDLSIIIKILPLLIAANYYELISLWGTQSLVADTIYRICEIYFKTLRENDLDFFYSIAVL